MKKVLITVLAVFSVLLAPVVKAEELPEKTDHEKVKVYLFWSNSCHNCHNLMKYFADKYQKYTDYFEIVTYRVDNDSVNSELSSNIAKQVGENPGYVPLVIIGNTYHVLGWQDSLGTTIIDEALKAYQDENYTDIVQKEIEDSKLSATAKTFTEALDTAEIEYSKDGSTEKNSDALIVGVVFGVILVGFAGLVIISRKN